MTYKIDDKDLFMIVSNAKDKFFNLNLPIWVSRSEVERGEIPSLAILESVLMFLNGKGLLTKMVEIDYTDTNFHDCDIPELEERKPTK